MIDWTSERRQYRSFRSFDKESDTLAGFSADFADVVDALEFGTGTLKASDDFDREGFLAFLREQRDLNRGSFADIRDQIERARKIVEARWGAKDPWEQLDIDWSQMAKNAREILNDPLDWSESDDFSPHGNDTGADIFAEWSDYARLSPESAAARVGWGEDFDLTNDLCWKDWVDINIALAFGHIKKKGMCPPDLAASVLKVIRAQVARIEAEENWQHRDEYLIHLNRYSKILEPYAKP